MAHGPSSEGLFHWSKELHWSDRYVGEPYIPQYGDCAALASRVAKDVLRIDPQLPVAHALTLREQSRQILERKDDVAERIQGPIDAQPVLFIGRGRVCHIGTMCWLAGEWWVLHADQTCGFVVRQRLRDMTRVHYTVEGFYRWI